MDFLKKLRGGKPRKKRVVVIGLDGVPFTYVQRLFQAGELPNFRAIVGDGALMQMDTTLPNVSSVAWASFMTGQNPGGTTFTALWIANPVRSKRLSRPPATCAPRRCGRFSALRANGSSR